MRWEGRERIATTTGLAEETREPSPGGSLQNTSGASPHLSGVPGNSPAQRESLTFIRCGEGSRKVCRFGSLSVYSTGHRGVRHHQLSAVGSQSASQPPSQEGCRNSYPDFSMPSGNPALQKQPLPFRSKSVS